ncbi:MAG: 4Fe-4S binding protein [Archaeoglobaceae archaeon]
MIEREIEADEKLKLVQKAEDEIRELIYDYKRCNGCGICVYACPVNAIELGPVHEIAKGMEMPPVIIDHLKCAYCGICFSFCPFNAFEFYINKEPIEKSSLPLSPVRYTYKYENCKECTLCYKVCPTKAISRERIITRSQIPEKNENLKGSVKIDRQKCNLCGICAEFCEVFKMVDKEISPTDIMPYSDILIDESKCDYCKLCEEICPEKAIAVEGKRILYRLPQKIAKITIEQNICSNCGYCEEICPYDAAKTIKPIEGKLSLFEARMTRCDPVGCGACLRICKFNRVWFVSEDRKRVYFNEKFCIYCGACENACPYDLILVERKNYFTKEMVFDAPWRNAWEDAVGRIVKKERVKQLEKISVSEAEQIAIEEGLEIGEKAPLKGLDKLEKIEELLRKVRYRKALETGDLEVFMRGVERALGENPRNGEQKT